MKFKIIKASIFLFIITACGYNVIDQNYSKKINIVETNITGDKRIAYLIRHKFFKSEKIDDKSVKLDLIIKKIKQSNLNIHVIRFKLHATDNLNRLNGRFFLI